MSHVLKHSSPHRLSSNLDYEEPAEGWSKAILGQLGSEAQRPTAPAAPAAMAATGSAIHDKRNPFPATIIDNLPIVGHGSTKETRHVEISDRKSTRLNSSH